MQRIHDMYYAKISYRWSILKDMYMYYAKNSQFNPMEVWYWKRKNGKVLRKYIENHGN